MVVSNREKAAVKAYQHVQRDHQLDELVLENLEYAQQIIGNMLASLPSGIDTDNLVGAGVLGLIEAAGKFDRSRNIAFKTFAFPRIRGAVYDELRRNSPLPQKLMKQISQIREALETLTPPVDLRQVGQLTGMTEAEVEDALAAMKICAPQSWDEIGRVIPDTHASCDDDPASRVEHEELVSRMAELIHELPERQRIVLMMYHMDGMLLKEIGEVLGISESRTSRVLGEAELRLKQLVELETGERTRD